MTVPVRGRARSTLIGVGFGTCQALLVAGGAGRAFGRGEHLGGAALVVVALVFVALNLVIVWQALGLVYDRAEHAERELAHERRRRRDVPKEKPIFDAIDRAFERACAAGKHREARQAIERWGHRNDETLTLTLRELEALTRPVGEA